MSEVLVTSEGRKLTLRNIDPTFLLSLAEAAEEASANTGFMRIASAYVLVDEIDGVPVPFPNTKEDIYAIGKMLGMDGAAALFARGVGTKQSAIEAEQAKN